MVLTVSRCRLRIVGRYNHSLMKFEEEEARLY